VVIEKLTRGKSREKADYRCLEAGCGWEKRGAGRKDPYNHARGAHGGQAGSRRQVAAQAGQDPRGQHASGGVQGLRGEAQAPLPAARQGECDHALVYGASYACRLS
jgi:hypothetical protein